jgi:hypothetical protein
MNTQMDNRMARIWFTLIGLIAIAAILGGVWASLSFNNFGFITGGAPPDPLSPRERIIFNPADLQFYYIARTVFSTINLALLVILTETYAAIYIKTRSQFTIGLLIFSLVFLIKEVTSSPFVIGAFRFTLAGLGPFALLEPMLETAALSVLLYLSVKY